MLHITVLGSTNGTDLVAIQEAIQTKKLHAKIIQVISDKDNAGILQKAQTYGIPHVFVDPKGKKREDYDQELVTLTKPLQPDVIVLIGYMRILTSAFINAFRNKIINVHPSLLPKFAGGMDLNVHKAVIESKVPESGCTIHIVDETIDGGAILCQKKVLIERGETQETLKQKVQQKEGEAFVEVLQKWSNTPPQIKNNIVTGWKA